MGRTKGRPSLELDKAVLKKKKNTKPVKKKAVGDNCMTDNEDTDQLINKCDKIIQKCDNVISASCNPCAVQTDGVEVTRRTRGSNKSCQSLENKSVSDSENVVFHESECVNKLGTETFVKDLETSEHTLDTVTQKGNNEVDTKCDPSAAKNNDIRITRQNSRSLNRSCKNMKRKSNNSIENEVFDSNDNSVDCVDKPVNSMRAKRNKCTKRDSDSTKNLPLNVVVGTNRTSAKKTKDAKEKKRQTRRVSNNKSAKRKSMVSSEDEVFEANDSKSEALDELETIIRSRFIKQDEETSTNNLPLNSIETKFLNELDSSEHALTSTPSITKRKRKCFAKLKSKDKKSKTIKLRNSVVEACKTDGTCPTDTKATHPDTEATHTDTEAAHTDEEPWHNMSLPTPTIGSSHSMSFDANLDVDACDDTGPSDSDDELPVGLTPVKYEKTISENDLVWVKYKKYHYPAFVKTLYKKTKHLTVIFFSPASEPTQTLRLSYANTNKVMPYFHPRREELKRAGEAGPEKAYFKACLQRLDDFLLKKALHQLKGDDLSFFKTDALDFLDLGDDIEDESTATDVKQELVPVPKVVVSVDLSKKGQLRKVKLSEKTKPLTEFLISEDCKDYLTKIYLTKISSDLHDTFMTGTRKQRVQMKHKGFGPIDDEDQIETIILTYIGWLGECCKSEYLHKNDYVFDVWIPEAIVKALTMMKSYSKKKAWEMFAKGVRITKEELMIDHEAIIRKSSNKEEEPMDDSV